MTTPPNIDSLLHAFSEPIRCRIVELLVTEKAALVPTYVATMLSVKLPVASRHLNELYNAKVVHRLPSGRNVLYSINPESLRDLMRYFSNLESDHNHANPK